MSDSVSFNIMTIFDKAIEQGLIKGNFAQSLSTQANGNINRLSMKQREWVTKLLNDNLSGNSIVESESGKSVSLIFFIEKLIASNSETAKIRLFLDSEDGYKGIISIKMAGSESSNKGCAYVKFKNDNCNIYVGKINAKGNFVKSNQVDDTLANCIYSYLKECNSTELLVTAAKKYAFLTSNCSFCGIKLTDERSVKVGYGPVCSSKYQLPWG